MNFAGCNTDMKNCAKQYLIAAYSADGSPTSIARKEGEVAKLNGIEVVDISRKIPTPLQKPRKRRLH